MVKIASLQDFQHNLDRYLQRVEAGESFELFIDDRPVAILSPPAQATTGDLQQLIGERGIRPARLDLLWLGKPPKLSSDISISQALAELRGGD